MEKCPRIAKNSAFVTLSEPFSLFQFQENCMLLELFQAHSLMNVKLFIAIRTFNKILVFSQLHFTYVKSLPNYLIIQQ